MISVNRISVGARLEAKVVVQECIAAFIQTRINMPHHRRRTNIFSVSNQKIFIEHSVIFIRYNRNITGSHISVEVQTNVASAIGDDLDIVDPT